MPHIARRYNNSGPIIEASDVKVTDMDDEYYCATKGCQAKMTLINAGNIDEAYFRRKTSSPDHINTNCVKCNLKFDKTKYDESLFQKDVVFDWLYEKPLHRSKCSTGSNTNSVGGKVQGIHTLKQIYEMCATRGKNDTYNGVLINDIFADEENCAVYKMALVNNLIVECSYFKKAYQEESLIMNYPTDYKKAGIHLKINFADKSIFWHYYYQFKEFHHDEPIVIAGFWKSINGHAEAEFECDIISSRQIYIV